ncbi:hypothetical protein [Streptomyces sp. V2]|nr:hypothetical protein [Streptomyces sp. V2]
MKMRVTLITMTGGGGGEGGDNLPGEPWPVPDEEPSPDGGARFIG